MPLDSRDDKCKLLFGFSEVLSLNIVEIKHFIFTLYICVKVKVTTFIAVNDDQDTYLVFFPRRLYIFKINTLGKKI